MGTRREFIKRAGYAAPVVLTMTAKPAFASTGSDRPDDRPQGKQPSRGPKKPRGRRGNHKADW